MRILSVDPGRESGWCLRTEHGIEEHGACNGSCVATVDDIVTSALVRHTDKDRTVYLEEPVIRAFERTSRKGIATQIRRAEIWAVLAERHGVMVYRVSASTWQAYLKLRGKHEQRMQGLKALLRSQSYDVDVMTEDEMCACGIDLWAAAQRRET